MRKKNIFKKVRFGKIRAFIILFFRIGLFNRQVGKLLIDDYDGHWGHQTTRETGNLGFGFFHFSLISSQKPKRVLCVGSQQGFIPAICALACKSNGIGHVDFIDAGYDQGHSKAWSGIGFWKKVNPSKHFALLGISNWISTYVMTTEEFSKKFLKRNYNYIYIDGDHTYEGVKNDFRLLWPHMKKDGFMSFHDILNKGYFRKKYEFGVWKFWQELEKSYPHIYFSQHPGLGLIQKE